MNLDEKNGKKEVPVQAIFAYAHAVVGRFD